jgi:26S proteasome regulatory subunit T2
MEQIKIYLLLEEDFIQNQERLKNEETREEKNEDMIHTYPTWTD